MTAMIAGACTTSTSTSPWGPISTDTGTMRAATAGPSSDNDWTTYHGTYQSWHYSPLTQINADNVKNLQLAWVHHPGRSTRGLQSMPLVADGVLYYTGSYSRVWAIDAATGNPLWSYFPAQRRPRRGADALAVYAGHRARPGQGLRGHRRRAAHRHRPEDRAAGVGHEAHQLREAHRRLHGRTPAGQGQGHHRLPGR
jgi:hypothetical protein